MSGSPSLTSAIGAWGPGRRSWAVCAPAQSTPEGDSQPTRARREEVDLGAARAAAQHFELKDERLIGADHGHERREPGDLDDIAGEPRRRGDLQPCARCLRPAPWRPGSPPRGGRWRHPPGPLDSQPSPITRHAGRSVVAGDQRRHADRVALDPGRGRHDEPARKVRADVRRIATPPYCSPRGTRPSRSSGNWPLGSREPRRPVIVTTVPGPPELGDTVKLTRRAPSEGGSFAGRAACAAARCPRRSAGWALQEHHRVRAGPPGAEPQTAPHPAAHRLAERAGPAAGGSGRRRHPCRPGRSAPRRRCCRRRGRAAAAHGAIDSADGDRISTLIASIARPRTCVTFGQSFAVTISSSSANRSRAASRRAGTCSLGTPSAGGS